MPFVDENPYFAGAAPQQDATPSREIDFSQYPRFAEQFAAKEAPARGVFGPGLRAGFNELQAMGGAAASALGGAVGYQPLQEWGADVSRANQAEAAKYGRPDLETAPWREGGAGWLPWLGYQAAKQIPLAGATMLGTALFPEAAVPAALSRAGAAVPELLGGGGLRAGMSAAATAAAETAGKQYAKSFLGGSAVNLPVAAGSMYQEAMDRPGGPTQEDAIKALAMAPAYAATEGLGGALGRGIISEAATKGITATVGRAALRSAVEEGPTEAAQTAMELSFRPDMSPAQKASQIVDAALTGAAVGGVFGAAGGGVNAAMNPMRATKDVAPNQLTNDDILDSVDQTLGPLPNAPAQQADTEQVTAPAAPSEPAPPPMMAQIAEAEAPEAVAKEESAAAAERVEKVQTSVADAMEGGAIAQNVKVVQRVLGDAQSLPDAISRFFDIQDQADQKKGAAAGKLTAAQKKIGSALGITDSDGRPLDIDAEINTLTQQLTAAQTPQARQQITNQIDRLDLIRPVIEEVRASRTAPVESIAPAPEEMLTPPPREAAPATEEAPVAPAPAAAPAATLTAEAEDLLAKGGIPFKVTQNLAKIAKENGIEVKGASGAEAQRIVAELQAIKDSQTAAPATEIPSAIQEQGPTGVYVQPAPETGGAVGEGNAQGGEAPGEGIGAASETQPEIPAAPPSEVAPPPAPAPSPAAQTFMQQQGIKQLSPEERIAARERQKVEEAAFLQKRQAQIRAANAKNAQRGGVTAAPVTPKGMTPEEFLARRNRERPATGLPETESPLDRDISTLVENNASGKQVLDYLGQNGATEFDRLYAQHLSRLGVAPSVQFADVNDPSLDIDRDAVQGEKIYGSYNVEQNRVNLYERANAAQIMLHEATHAATDRAIRTSSPAARQLKAVFDEFKSRPERYGAETPAYKHEAEFISEAFSNPDFREFLKTLQVGPKNLWEKFKDAVFKLLRMPQRARTVFDQVMEVGEPLFQENQQTTMEDVYRAMGEEPINESPFSVNEQLGKIATTLGKVADKFDRTASLGVAARQTILGWNSITHMATRYGKLFTSGGTNWIQKYADYNQERAAVAARMSQLFKNVYDDYKALEKKSAAVAETFRKLMALTEFNIDWRKSWDAQTWLHDQPNSKDLQRLHADMRREGGRLDADTKGLFDRFEAVNNVTRYAQMSLSLYNMIVADPAMAKNIANSDVDPIDEFLQQSSLHENPAEAQTYWRKTLEKQLAAADPFIKAQNRIMRKGATAAERSKARQILQPLSQLVDSTKQTMTVMKQSPNFHLGRFGDYMVTFQIKKDEAGIDADAQRRVAAAMDAAGVQAQLSPENNNPTVFVRVETIEQAKKLQELARDMQKRGWLNPDVEPKAGLRTDSEFRDIANPQWLQKYIEALQSETFEDEGLKGEAAEQAIKNRKQMVQQARELYLNMLPDNALAKVLTERKSIAGYSPDMMRSFAFRHQIGMNTIANLATMHNIAGSLTEMRRIINAAKTGDVQDTVKLQNIFNEISQRETGRSMQPQNSFWDSVRAFNHAYFLGASPSYVLVNMTQPGVLLWPELSKQHGYVNSGKAIASVTPTAFKVMAAVMKVSKSADAIITEKSLKASGVDEATADFIMRVANTGNLDLGSTSRELGRVVDKEMDSRTDQLLRWAAAAGYYSETFTRLSAALAARELYQNKSDTEGMMAYVNKTINESMLNYSSWNTARQMGKMGVAGEYTPVMFSFMTYQAQVLEKMYRELRDAFGGSPEARRFLLSHAAALTVLSGSLGLPFASVAARVFDGLKDAFGDDDEPSDVKSAWRNFLADMFGKEVGEVLARGVPRALGFDVSSRVGEADLAPFSRFLTDRREWRDAAQDMALRTLGSPVSMALNILEGGTQFARGDAIEGLQKMVPNSLKGPIAAYRMAEDGRYVDSKGRELPMEPGAQDVLIQALGFTPQAKAEYQEASMAQTVRKGLLTREGATLRDQLVDAIMDNSADRDRLTQKAVAYDQAHPDRPILKSVASTIKRRREGLALSRATGAPLGVKPQDVGARGLTTYMNVDMQ